LIRRWQQGRADIEGLLESRRLQAVAADRDLAELYLDQARRHLESARSALPGDPAGSFQLAYDAGRKALTAVLENQGLRVTSRGGHIAIEESLRAQLVPPMGRLINDFGWMRMLRNQTEYPTFDRPMAAREDAEAAARISANLVAMAERLLDEMPVW
jgi:hypothetical protein